MSRYKCGYSYDEINGFGNPTDWNSILLAVGEIDLALLTERWPANFVMEVIADYQSPRRSSVPSLDLENSLVATKYYNNRLLNWMSDYRKRVEKKPWIIKHMHKAKEELRLI
jgi:hypothetical protein